MRPGLSGLVAACLAALPVVALRPAPAGAEPQVAIVPLPFRATEFRSPTSRVAAVVGSTDALREAKVLGDRPAVVVWGGEGGAALVADGAALRVLPLGRAAADLATLERTPDAIPGSRIEAAGPLSAALTGPDRSYAHDALGSPVHAAAVTLRERKPVAPAAGAQRVPQEVSVVPAGPGAVFEDREPRLVALGGEPAIVTVRSRPEQGSALAVIARREGVWRIVAETPPLGGDRRWLNPAGIADFRGTGGVEIALVKTPHGEGVLQLWRLEGDRLALVAEAPGYANHAFGKAAQDLAAVVSLGGKRLLAIPTADRGALALVAFEAGRVREQARIPLPGRAATGVAALGSGADLHVLVGLDDGRVADIRP